MAVGFGVITVVVGIGGHWNLLFLLLPGGAMVAFIIMAVNSFRSETSVSDSGVRPSGPRSDVVPWQQIAAFTPLSQDRAVGVFLVRTENRRPLELDALSRRQPRAQEIADELNALLRTRPREDADMGTSVGQRCYVRAVAGSRVFAGPCVGFLDAQLPQADGTVATVYGQGDAIGWRLRKSDSDPPGAFLLAEVVAVPHDATTLTVRLFRAEDRAGRTDFTVSRTLITTTEPGG
jgi:hypothetical protein